MKNSPLPFIIFILIIGLLTNCKKDDPKCANDLDFCTLIEVEDYNETGLLLDNYLSGLKSQLSDEQKLGQLKDWLECKSCVSKAEILCNSCIFTDPPKSSLKLSFVFNDQQKEKQLYIVMDNPLRFSNYND